MSDLRVTVQCRIPGSAFHSSLTGKKDSSQFGRVNTLIYVFREMLRQFCLVLSQAEKRFENWSEVLSILVTKNLKSLSIIGFSQTFQVHLQIT